MNNLAETVSQEVRLNRPFGQQNEQEFAWLLQFARGAKSLLEIGSCFGHSLRLLAGVAEPKARIRSIDLGYGTHALAGTDTGTHLLRTIVELRERGFDAQALFASSKTVLARQWADYHGPFDFIFIDGDHDYSAVKADWQHYKPLGKVVAFHDIAYEGHQVGRLWAEIKADGSYHTVEKIASHMGIGVVLL